MSKSPIKKVAGIFRAGKRKAVSLKTWLRGFVERWAKIFEFFAFLSAIVTAWFIGIQWNEMTKASKIADNQLGVMQGQLDEMRKDRVLDERAWVGSFEGEVDAIENPTNSVCFKVRFKNTGKSPALNLTVCIGQTHSLQQIPMHDIRPSNAAFSGALYPESIGTITTSEPIQASTVKLIEVGMPYYVYGTIWYDDIFGNHHWSQFSYWITFTPKADFLPTSVHNACDDAQTSKPQQ